MKGIYAYKDSTTDNFVYIGKDSNIERQQRHKEHHWTSRREQQHINKVLQNNPNRYDYQILKTLPVNASEDDLNQLERDYIKKYYPLFNFTEGGEGCLGYKHTKESRELMSKLKTGFKHSEETKAKISKNSCRYWKGKHLPQNTIEKIRLANIGKKLSEETRKKISEGLLKNPPMKGVKYSDEKLIKLSKSHNNTTGYFRVSIQKDKCCKQGFRWCYKYYDNSKYRNITCVNLEELEKKVKDKGLLWVKFDDKKEGDDL